MATRTQKYQLSSACRLILQSADITALRVDAIVNPANERMLGGSGCDGAIHRKAGPQLLQECKSVPEVRHNVRCPTGEARITKGYNLPAKHVVHTVGPVYSKAKSAQCAELLRSAHDACLDLAAKHNVKTICFPCVSCGVYGYPPSEAAQIALESCQRAADNFTEISFAIFDPACWKAWSAAAEFLKLPHLDS